MDMSIEKHYVNEADWGVLMLYIDKKFCIMRYSILLAYTTKQEENNVGRDKKRFFGSNYTRNDVIINGLIDKMTLFDDNLMSLVFGQNIETTELLLRVIMERDIKVIDVRGQDELKNPVIGGRCITLDVHAIDVDGRHIDIEVQINAEGSHVKRARYHSSMMDARMLEEGQEFKEIKDSYVIFIYDHDKFRKRTAILSHSKAC